MKNIFLKILLLALLLTSVSKHAQAQTTDSTNEKRGISAIYGGFGAGWLPPSEMVTEFGLHGFLANHWGLSLTYRGYSFDARNKPDDYLSGGQNNPLDEITFPTLWVSRAFPTRFKAFRFVVQAGVSYVNYKETIFTPHPNALVNYSTSKETRQTVGGSINIKTELMPIRYMGLEVGVSAHFNSFRSAFTIDCNLLLGVLKKQ